ncbi:MAG TPA: hypothetical protein VEX57_20890 [Microlunatus sp.]|nr:hypothetical protein [Microlunatus sp.]
MVSDTGWRALGLRLAVVTLPAHLVGAFLGIVPTLLVGRHVLSVPWLPTLTLVGMGGVAGLAIGYLAHPPRQPRGLAVAVAAGFGLVGFAVIVLLVRLRLPAGVASSSLNWLVGAVVVVAVQSAVVGLLWRRRAAAAPA